MDMSVLVRSLEFLGSLRVVSQMHSEREFAIMPVGFGSDESNR